VNSTILLLLSGMAAVLLVRDASLTVPFSLPKLFALYVATAAFGVVLAAQVSTGRATRPSVAIAAPLAVLLVCWVLSSFWSVDARSALFGAYGRGLGLFTHLAFAATFLFLATAKAADVYGRCIALVLAMVPVALVAILQSLGIVEMGMSGDAQIDLIAHPQTRPYGTIGHPVPFAALLGLGTPLAMIVILRERSAAVRWAVAVVLLLFGLTSAMTLSRGPWIGTAVAAAIVMMAAQSEGFVNITRRRAGAIGAAAALCAIVLLGPAGIGRIALRIAAIGTGDAAFTNRFAYAQSALRITREYPLFGSGFDTFGVLYPRYRTSNVAVPVDAIPTMVHNGYLHIAATNGVPALIAYLALIAAILRRLYVRWLTDPSRDARLLAAALAAAIGGFLVQDLTGWEEVPVTMAFWAVLGLGAAFGSASNVRPLQWRRPYAAAAATAFSLLMLGSAAVTLTALSADRSLARASTASPGSDWSETQRELANAVRGSRFHPFVEDAAGVRLLQRFDVTQDAGAYAVAAQLFRDAARQNPHAPYPLIHRIDLERIALTRGTARTVSADAETAVARLERLDPLNPTVHESIARLRLAQGHAAEGLASIRRATRLQPRHRRYPIWEGDALRTLGDHFGALEAYRRGVGLTDARFPEWLVLKRRVVLTLLELGQVSAAESTAATIFEAIDDPQTRAALAAVHAAR
jgi:O-antigen ligase/tetratricopeptide (TPR) repeat protein